MDKLRDNWTDEELEDLLADAISDSLDMDWGVRDGAKAIMRELAECGLHITRTPERQALVENPPSDGEIYASKSFDSPDHRRGFVEGISHVANIRMPAERLLDAIAALGERPPGRKDTYFEAPLLDTDDGVFRWEAFNDAGKSLRAAITLATDPGKVGE